MRKAFRPLGDLLARYAGDVARHTRWVTRDVAPLWFEVVGPQAAAHLRPVRYRAGELMIHADGAIWSNWMRVRQAELLKRLAGREPLTGLRRLSVRIVPIPGNAAGTARMAAPRPRPMTNRTRDLIEDTAQGLADPELRDALERLAGRHGGENG